MSTEPQLTVARWLPWLALAGLLVLVTGLAFSVLLLFRTAAAAADAPSVPLPAAATTAPAAASGPAPAGISSWAGRIARATGIPEPAVTAYGQAQLAVTASDPGCHLCWNTLAGIATVESDNGGYGGARLTPDGEETAPIIGVRLDGAPGVRAVPDTDHGALDGDPDYDRAVGPFQFLPSTWKQYAGSGDPQNIDAAALAAAHYLCGGGRDLATATGWWSAVLAYNNSTDYAAQVLRLAGGYAKAG